MTVAAPQHLPTHEALDHPVSWRVLDTSVDGDDVVTVYAHPVDGPLPPFEPAQFSMIGIAAIGEVPISISTPTTDDRVHGFTIRRAGAVTDALVRVRRGDVVTVRGPFGRPWDLRSALGRDLVFVGGGIGIAPLRAAIHAAIDDHDRYGPISVLVGATEPRRVVYADWLADLAAAGVVTVRQTVDRVPDGACGGHAVGLVTELLPAVVQRSASELYVCGPDPMMRTTVTVAAELGIDPAHVQLTLERNMHCGVGWCGHCQLGGMLVCRDGPVARASELGDALGIEEW